MKKVVENMIVMLFMTCEDTSDLISQHLNQAHLI